MHIKAALLSLLLLSTSAMAQADSQAREPFVLLPGDIEIDELVNVCANYLGWNILLDQQEIDGHGKSSTKLQRPVTTDQDGCEELLYTLLYRKGLAVIPIDAKRNICEVVSMTGPRGREVPMAAVFKTPEQILLRPQLKVPVVTLVDLKHTNAQLANNALRPFFANSSGKRADGVSIGSTGNMQSLLIQGFQHQVAQAIRLIKLSDVPQEDDLRMVNGMRTKDHIKSLNERIKKLEEKLEALLMRRK